MTLTNYTLDFLEKEWSAEIDFVIWTGDSARYPVCSVQLFSATQDLKQT